MKVKLYTLLLLLIFLIACAPTSTSQSPHPLRTLIVYSPYPSHLIRPILNDFEKREHVKVEIKHGSTQVLLSNIHKEALSKRGDVFVGGVLSEMMIIKKILFLTIIVLH